ncbi:MAG TPA: glutamate--tRNA ligase [Vitreimonas sp.]|uniref:glutamate--tRNA ligase n=1 Tax=Vitreimonas sp. TaxID=3069702 RepID=UPI002D290407|nr:glutamate--tRNA ligase [Vitreimonas sp.]HYD87502.1 glutamate--tRNA ligase [Vitreimonas sp.]
MSVVTRFAPSPTGYLHIGGARTALFNWLYARKMGGKYLLRIEDTDRARSTPDAIEKIMDGLAWLDLQHDGEIIYQYARAPRHREIAEEMVRRGGAFRCYLTPEETEAVRAQAHAEGRAIRSPYRDGEAPPSPDAPYVVRIRAPDVGEIVNADLIQGDVRIKARDLDDLVLLRADGNPTYMLSVVVDDHDMGVTHVIRGDDHLTNAARQIVIYQAMDWTPPLFAHVPLIHGEDGKKLSKRHGAQAVHEWRDMGYLPEAMNAYLMRLGWSPGHDEILTKEEAVAQFEIGQIGKAPSRLDFKKLDSVNALFMATADDERLARLLAEHIAQRDGAALGEDQHSALKRAMPVLKKRAKTIPELAEQARFILAKRPLALDEAAKSLMKDDFRQRLGRLHEKLAAEQVWEHAALGSALKAFATAEGVGLGQIGPGLRAALTGGTPAPDLGQALEVLGREEALARIADQV